jgi:tRNA pseudouridine13 synthase
MKALSPFSLDFSFAYGNPEVGAVFRATHEDFDVEEQLGFEPCGTGEHIYLYIRKRGENTEWVARQIARFAAVKPMDVGYCGLKDRRAVSRQWFSVYRPKGTELNWASLTTDTVECLSVARHTQKLRRGNHAFNRFTIRLRQLTQPAQQLLPRLEQIQRLGVPNYFGEQRFGHEMGNLQQADTLLRGDQRIRNRQKRGLFISAARSYLFNLVLSERVRRGDWSKALPGDPLVAGEASGPLWGRGRSLAQAATLALETDLLEEWQEWCHGLEHLGLNQERRALILRPHDMSWCCNENVLSVTFSLPPGGFATAVLRELCCLNLPDDKDAL